jgi:hypothetical protein
MLARKVLIKPVEILFRKIRYRLSLIRGEQNMYKCLGDMASRFMHGFTEVVIPRHPCHSYGQLTQIDTILPKRTFI